MAKPTTPAARLVWINNQRAFRGLAPLTLAALETITTQPSVYGDPNSDACAELRERAD